MRSLSRCLVSERLEIEYSGLTVVEVRRVSLREMVYAEFAPAPEPDAAPGSAIQNYVVRSRGGADLRSFGCFMDAKDWLDASRNGHRVVRIPDHVMLAIRRPPLTTSEVAEFRRHAGRARE